jgi:HEAT repeat protein
MMMFWLLACSPAAEDIAKAIGSENPVMREDGAKIAQNYDDEVVVDALIAVLGDPSEKVRLNAIESLAEILDQKCGPALIERLKTDPSPMVRKAAADALGRVLFKDSVPALIDYANEFAVDDTAQLVAIWAIGRIGYEGLDADNKKLAMEFLVSRREKATDRYVLYNISVALRYLK